MSAIKNKKLVPKLRFPEFNGSWEEKRINNVLERYSNPVDVETERLYQQIGIRSHGKGIFYKDYVTGKDLGNKRVFWIKDGMFIVNIVFFLVFYRTFCHYRTYRFYSLTYWKSRFPGAAEIEVPHFNIHPPCPTAFKIYMLKFLLK